MKMFKAAILAYTGIIATAVSGAPVGGGGSNDIHISDVVAPGTVSFHVPTEFPASRFTGGPRKGPCGVECNTATEVNDKIGPTVMDPFGPRPTMTLNTSPGVIRPGPTFVIPDPAKITFVGTPIQISSDVDTRIPRTVVDSKSQSKSSYTRHNIVFVTTSSTISTGVSTTSEPASVFTPLLPPFNIKPPMTGHWSKLPEPRLTTIEPSATSTTLPEPSTSGNLPEPQLTTVEPSATSYTNTTQASSAPVETDIILTTITQYVTPAPFATTAQTNSSAMVHTPKTAEELSFTTVVTAREPALSNTGGETKTRHNGMGIEPFGRRA